MQERLQRSHFTQVNVMENLHKFNCCSLKRIARPRHTLHIKAVWNKYFVAAREKRCNYSRYIPEYKTKCRCQIIADNATSLPRCDKTMCGQIHYANKMQMPMPLFLFVNIERMMDLCIRNIATDETLCLPEYFGDFALVLGRVDAWYFCVE